MSLKRNIRQRLGDIISGANRDGCFIIRKATLQWVCSGLDIECSGDNVILKQ
jgi:hypothetical protein